MRVVWGKSDICSSANHFGRKPRSGGSPPKESRISRAVIWEVRGM